jgi:small GTP-binding protein
MRNFAICAHIDHGKSTLADRLLELTGAIPTGGRKQYLDRLEVERARGITVKAQSASLLFTPQAAEPRATYLLNLVDTPGHVDFSYEVQRSLSACQGCLLLVDASQGIQAQTIANHRLAVDAGLAIVPVLNKIDLPHAEPDRVAAQMVAALGVPESSILRISAKSGLGVTKLLEALVERLPPPTGQPDGLLRVLLLVRLT